MPNPLSVSYDEGADLNKRQTQLKASIGRPVGQVDGRLQIETDGLSQKAQQLLRLRLEKSADGDVS
jgi:hypothetical protein